MTTKMTAAAIVLQGGPNKTQCPFMTTLVINANTVEIANFCVHAD